MNNNFDLKKYLIENKMTRNSKIITENNIQEENKRIPSSLIRFLDKHELNNEEIKDHEYIVSLIDNYSDYYDVTPLDDETAENFAKQYHMLKMQNIQEFQESSLEEELLSQLDEQSEVDDMSQEEVDALLAADAEDNEQLDEMDYDFSNFGTVDDHDELYHPTDLSDEHDEYEKVVNGMRSTDEEDEDEELYENKKPSAGLTKKEKSKIVKKARAGKDIGEKGKEFEKISKSAGGGEKGKRIAATQMWRKEASK